MFYISRPTLEKLRKTGSTGALYYELLKEAVTNFLDDSAIPKSNLYDGKFVIKTKLSNHHSEYYATIAYPFDVSSEVDNKFGVVLHLGDGKNEASEKEWTLSKISGRSEYYSMFNPKLHSSIKEQLGGDGVVWPPGLKGATKAKIDPMWSEFSQAKLLITDQLLDPDVGQGEFRNIISHQYIEVRLNKYQTTQEDRVSSKEQLLAIEKYESHDSGYVNFAGAPGTGKSTLLHMITAHELFKNFGGGDSKILYYVPIQFLAEEAKREIHSILRQIYLPALKYQNVKNSRRLLDQSRENLSVVTIEAMTGGLIPGRGFNISRKKSTQSLLGKEHGLGLNAGQRKRVKQMKDGLRRVVFGVFGDAQAFKAWHKSQKNQVEKKWKRSPILLSEPGGPLDSRHHKFTLNDFFSWRSDEHDINQFINDLAKISLYDGRGTDQFWDHATNIHHLSKLNHHGPGTTWSQLKGRIDHIVIDEVQDISITEVRALLNHFGNRQDGAPLRPFRLITAGDENQDIRDLVYVPENRHFRALYDDWVQGLKLRSLTQSGYQLSHGLNPVESIPLVSGYRVFDEMVGFANDIMKHIYDEYQTGEEARKGRQGRMEVTQYGRNGIFIHLKEDLSDNDQDTILDMTDDILGQLEKQLTEPNNSNVTVQVAVTYDKNDFNPGGEDLEKRRHPFFSRLREENDTIINRYFNEKLDKLFTEFTDEFLQKSEGSDLNMVEQELKNELRLRGVMDVDAIKGLTMPMAIVIPPKELKKGIDQLSKDHLTKFLVQITRAQYVCIIIDNTRKLRESAAVVSGVQGSPRDWIDNILNNSAGFDPSFSSLFNATMREYNSITLWERLEKEAKNIGPDLEKYVKWLRSFLTKLNTQPLHLNQLKNEFIEIKRNKINFKNVTMPGDIETNYMLNDRLNNRLLPALVLFALTNAHLRTVNEHGRSSVTEKDVNQAMVWWTNHNGQLETDEEKNVRDWFALLTGPEKLNLPKPMEEEDEESEGEEEDAEEYGSKDMQEDNLIEQQVRHLFHFDGSFQWPQTYAIRLPMGGWNIPSLNPINGSDNFAQLREMAWMEDNSSFYTIDPSVLSLALDSHSPTLIGRSMLKLYIGITNLDVDIFADGFAAALQYAKEEEKQFILSWFTRVFNSEAMIEREAFRNGVRERLQAAFQTYSNIPAVFSSFLSASPTISDFQQRLNALSFENWSVAIPKSDGVGMFQHTCLRLAFERIGPPVRMARLRKEIHTLEVKEKDFLNEINEKEKDIASLKVDQLAWISENYAWTNEYPSLRELNNAEKKQEKLVEMEASKALGTQPFPRGSPQQQWFRQQKKILDEEKALENTKLELDRVGSELLKKGRGLDTEIAGGFESLPPNPFQRKGSVYHFFDALLESPKNGKSPDQHRMWFTLLWGLPEFFNGNFQLEEFGMNTLILPSEKISGTLEQIQTLLEAYCPDNNSKRIDAVFEKIKIISQPKISREKQVVDHDWVFGLMRMLESMVEQREWSGAFTNTFYTNFRNRMKQELQPLMLKHLLNVEPNSNSVLKPKHLREYLSSAFARLVYASWTHDYLIDTSQDMLPLWEELDGAEKENWKARVSNKSHREPPALHHRWAGHSEELDILPFTNAASFRAFACLARSNTEQAIVEFIDAGLLNHAAALRLTHIDRASDTMWYDLYKAVQALCGREEQLLQWSLIEPYMDAPELNPKAFRGQQDMEDIAAKLVEEMANYEYGIGPSLRQIFTQIDDKEARNQISLNSEYHYFSNQPINPIELSVSGNSVEFDSSRDRWEVKPSLPSGLKLTGGSTITGTPKGATPAKTYTVKLMRQGRAVLREVLSQPVIISVDQPPTDLTISKRKGDPKRWMLGLFNHAQRVHHFAKLHDHLEELMNQQKSMKLGAFRDGIKRLADQNLAQHQLFWSEKEQKANAGVFKWNWTSRGYKPVSTSPNFTQNRVVYDFLLAVMNEEGLEKAEFQDQIEELTAISGATIGFLMPERAELEIDETKEKLAKEKNYEHEKDEFIQWIHSLQMNYVETQYGSLERLAGDIKNELDNAKFNDAMGRVTDAGWLHQKNHQEMKNRLEQLEIQWYAMNE